MDEALEGLVEVDAGFENLCHFEEQLVLVDLVETANAVCLDGESVLLRVKVEEARVHGVADGAGERSEITCDAVEILKDGDSDLFPLVVNRILEVLKIMNEDLFGAIAVFFPGSQCGFLFFPSFGF